MNSPIKLPPMPNELWATLDADQEDRVYAYAEQAVRDALAAQVPVAWLNKDSLVRLSKPHVAGCAAAIENRPRGGFVPIAIIPENNHE